MKKASHAARIGKLQCVFMLAGVIAISGCATTQAESQGIVASKADPYERINRKIYTFNDRVDDYIAEPIANAYKWITPQLVQTGVFNFYNNLKNINVVFNDVMQAKFEQGARDTGRFLMNSTLGLLGVVDVAKHVGLEQNNEDFDQTLAVWGVPKGPYLVIPFLGPTTTRGIPGAIFDTAANPSSYVGAPVQLVSLLNTRANAEGALKFIDEAALDPYVFTRESFLQWRHSLATDGKSEASDFDEGLDESEDDALAKPGLAGVKKDFSVDLRKFEQASLSFNKAAESFEGTAKSFEEAGHKIERSAKKRRSKKHSSKH